MMARAFLFNHPGGEHVPPRGDESFGWNTGRKHKRKFIVAEAYLAERDGEGYRRSARTAEVAFWGEWEPPSACGRFEEDPANALLPRAWHRPIVGCPSPPRAQNTDPWVFGERFLYSNCRQNRKELRGLQPGDVLLFGSVKKMAAGGAKTWPFYLDTVFVVERSWPYRFERQLPQLSAGVKMDGMFRSHVLEVLGNQERQRDGYLLYHGAMLVEGKDKPFSYVPCRLTNRETACARFARPRVDDLFGVSLPNPQLGLQPLPCDARDAWLMVTERCRDKSLGLAVSISLPAGG